MTTDRDAPSARRQVPARLTAPAATEAARYLTDVIRASQPCVGAVIKDRGNRLLLIKRGHEPGAGLWSLPGGRIEPGETDQQAVAREVLEETGLRVECGHLLGAVELPGPDGAVIQVSDYLAVVTGGELAAGRRR